MPLHFQGQNVLWTLNSFLSADLCSFKPFTLWTFKSRTSMGVWRDAHLPSSKVTKLFNSWAAVASTYPPAFSQDKDGKWERVHWEGKSVYLDWLEEWGDWVEGETECFALLMATWLLLLHWKCRNTKCILCCHQVGSTQDMLHQYKQYLYMEKIVSWWNLAECKLMTHDILLNLHATLLVLNIIWNSITYTLVTQKKFPSAKCSIPAKLLITLNHSGHVLFWREKHFLLFLWDCVNNYFLAMTNNLHYIAAI